jgi:thioredoxin-like negative regulator of GroEL
MGSSFSKTVLGSVAVLCIVSNGIDAHEQLVHTATTLPFVRSKSTSAAFLSMPSSSPMFGIRGGDTSTASDTTEVAHDEPSLDEKVQAAMKKLGMTPPPADNDQEDCEDGVCPMPSNDSKSTQQLDPTEMAERIAKEMDVDIRLCLAAVGATASPDADGRIYNEAAAKEMIQSELNLIRSIPVDSPEVHTLEEEGFDSFFARRALAFAENNLDDARAILLADQMDQEEEEENAKKANSPDFVEVKANFDPTKLTTDPTPAAPSTPAGNTGGMPKPAPKESVVFEATTAQIQKLVLESPVPVLLDVYADWCGPCKVLGPALEEMAIKSGGMFRLVKLNSDNERPLSQALEVTALPTVFGVRDGKIVHMFQGMPRSEDMMKNFLMGLFGAAPFSPPVTTQQAEKYKELTNKMIRTASAASFSFSARERLTDRITAKLDDMVHDDSVPDVEACATLIRTFVNNVIQNPYEQKYRNINLENKKVASVIGENASCLAVLKSVGFSKSGSEMILAKNKKVINVAPLVVAKDTIDNWIQRNRREMAAAARKRKDEQDRARLMEEGAFDADEEEVFEEEVVEEVDPSACALKLRLDGKKKIHDAVLHQDDPLNKVLEVLGVDESEEEIQVTCVAKRLVVRSSDKSSMAKTLGEHGLMPSASLVVKVGTGIEAPSSSLKERAADKKRKKGSHTMQSIGIYSKDDNNKAELIDGGGGVWYEHDITDDEAEGGEVEANELQEESSEVSQGEDAVQEADEGAENQDE